MITYPRSISKYQSLSEDLNEILRICHSEDFMSEQTHKLLDMILSDDREMNNLGRTLIKERLKNLPKKWIQKAMKQIQFKK